MCAVMHSHLPVVEYLLERGADMEAKSVVGPIEPLQARSQKCVNVRTDALR